MSIWLAIIMVAIPFVNTVITIIALRNASNTISTLTSIAPITSTLSIIDLILIYYVISRWIKRRNKHFHRQLYLERTIIDFLKNLNKDGSIDLTKDIVSYTKNEEEEREVIKYAAAPIILLFIFSFLALAALLIIFIILTIDFYEHEIREENSLEN